MYERDENILKHIGRYGISTRAVIERMFFDGATCDHVINRLLKEKRITSSTIPGGLCCYRLSLSEVRARSLPEHRAKPKKGVALRQALQVLWFCCMSEVARTKLERKQIAATFGNGIGSGNPHCAEADGSQSMVYRVYAPGPHSRDRYLLRTLKDHSEQATKQPLRSWIEAQSFSFAVLVETPQRKERLKLLISRTGPYPIRIQLEVVPGLSTFALAIRNIEEKQHAN